MCLIIDDREESCLRTALAPYDLTVTVARLEYGDAMWEGCGPGNRPVTVACERKRFPEFVKSMTDRRLSGHQLRGLWDTYDYIYLVLEGFWRPSREGAIEILDGPRWRPLFHRGSGVSYRQVDSYISSLELKGNIVVCRTMNQYETAALYASRFHWWQKPWDQHHSHDQIFARDPLIPLRRGRAIINTRKPGFAERVASQLDGVDRKAWDVAAHFGSVENMVHASIDQWMEIPGIGKETAEKAWKAWRGNAQAY